MCGIAGFVGRGNQQDLLSMNQALSHRGPDDARSWCDQERGIYLAMSRLAVLDPEQGQQPMFSNDRQICVVFNGEIYNHGELRHELEKRGHRFRSLHSDTETLIYGYREWGRELPKKLNGMWAMAILDRARGSLFLSRDRFGQKPLYYTHQKGLFAFASELTSLTQHSDVQLSLSRRAMQKYFAYGFIPAPLSASEGVFKLPAGFSATLDLPKDSFRTQSYWEFVLEPEEPPENGGEDAWCEELRGLLDQAVRRRLSADVPLGVFLSGGIDSTSVSTFAARATPDQSIKTFSIGFLQKSFDESEAALAVSQTLGSEHENRMLSIENAAEILPGLVGKLDEPMGDPSLVPTFQLSQLAREHVTVALGGDGADELFCGYDPFVALKWAQIYSRWVPKPVHSAIKLLAGGLPVSHRNMSFDFKIKRSLRGLSFPQKVWLPSWLGPLDLNSLGRLFHEELDPEDVFEEAISHWDNCNQKNIVDRTIQFFVKLYLQDDILTKIDRASMMHSLEVRSPFLDVDLVDFVRRIPWTYKFRHGQRKYLLKRALQGVVPDFVLKRSKKGFGVPMGRWFRTGVLEPSKGEGLPFLNRDFINGMNSQHRAGKRDHRAFLWNLWVLDSWMKNR